MVKKIKSKHSFLHYSLWTRNPERMRYRSSFSEGVCPCKLQLEHQFALRDCPIKFRLSYFQYIDWVKGRYETVPIPGSHFLLCQCLSTSLTKTHSARATGGGGRLPRVMKVACAWWRRWGQNRAISHTSLVLFCGHFPNKNEAIRTSDSDASWTCCVVCNAIQPTVPRPFVMQ